MKKSTYEYVKEQIEKTGYKLLSKEYKNAHTKLKIQCSKKHIYEAMWTSFQRKKRCPICFGNAKLTYDYVDGQIKKKGYKLLSKEYKNSYTKLLLQCQKKHIFKMKWAEFQQGTKCPICANKIRGNKRRHTYDYIKREIKKEGYELLSKKYVSAHIKLEVRCPKGHIYKVTWSRFYQGDRCPICNANFFSSKTEKEIAQIVESQGIKIKRNDRTQIINPLTSNKLELDIWVPKLNKAIEFNGKYWHSFKDKIIRDKIKTKQCVKKGIKLLVIKEQDWINNKTDCIDKIKNFVKDKTSEVV